MTAGGGRSRGPSSRGPSPGPLAPRQDHLRDQLPGPGPGPGPGPRPAPRRTPRPRFHALSRAYWPAGTRLPYLRLALGVAIAPWPVAALTSALIWWIYALTEDNDAVAWALTLEAAALTLYGLYLIAILGGVVAIPYLWATRRSAALPWIVAGAVAGAIIVLVVGLADGGAFNPTPYTAAMVLGAGTFLMIRWIAGVRRAP